MHAQNSPSTLRQYLEVAARLCRFHHPKSIFLSGHRNVRRVIARDLEKHSDVGTTFVRLPGGMQEAWSKAETRGHVFVIADGVPDGLQLFFMVNIHLDIAKQRKVIAGIELAKMRTE